MQRLRALASWMTTGVVTLALALAVVASGQLARVPTPVASPPVTTIAVSHRATTSVAHDVVRPARSRLVATPPVKPQTAIHKTPVRPTHVATTTVPSTTTSTTSTTTSTTTTSTTTTSTIPPTTTTTRPHRGDGGGGSGGGSDDPPGSY